MLPSEDKGCENTDRRWAPDGIYSRQAALRLSCSISIFHLVVYGQGSSDGQGAPGGQGCAEAEATPIHSFNQYLLSTYCMAGTVLGTEARAASKTDQNAFPCVLTGRHR